MASLKHKKRAQYPASYLHDDPLGLTDPTAAQTYGAEHMPGLTTQAPIAPPQPPKGLAAYLATAQPAPPQQLPPKQQPDPTEKTPAWQFLQDFPFKNRVTDENVTQLTPGTPFFATF